VEKTKKRGTVSFVQAWVNWLAFGFSLDSVGNLTQVPLYLSSNVIVRVWCCEVAWRYGRETVHGPTLEVSSGFHQEGRV
jgi:hypothetical protein